MNYIAENGTPITDELIEKWAAEAESGFPGAIVTPVEGRAWEKDTEPLKPRTIRLSDTMWALIDKAAADCKVSPSVWTRQALAEALSHNH